MFRPKAPVFESRRSQQAWGIFVSNPDCLCFHLHPGVRWGGGVLLGLWGGVWQVWLLETLPASVGARDGKPRHAILRIFRPHPSPGSTQAPCKALAIQLSKLPAMRSWVGCWRPPPDRVGASSTAQGWTRRTGREAVVIVLHV